MIKNLRGLLVILLLIVGVQLQAQIQSLQNRKVFELKDWKSSKGITSFAEKKDFNDAGWSTIKVSHIYSMDAIEDIGYYRSEAW